LLANESIQAREGVGPDNGVSRRFFRDTILNFTGQGFILLLTFLTVPYTVHKLGPDLFGVVALVQVIGGLSGLASLGVGRALNKFVSELYWQGDFQAINRLFQTAWGTCLIAGLVGIIGFIGPEELVGRLFFRGGPEVGEVVGFAIYVAAFGLFTSMLLEVVSALPAALRRFGVCNTVNVLASIVRCLGPVLVLAFGYSVRAVLVVILASNILALVAFALISRRFIPGLSLLPSFRWEAFRKLFDFSLPLFLSALFFLITTRVDRFILAYYLPLAAVTFYTLPYSIAERASVGVGNIMSVVLPFSSELHSMGAQEKLHELYLRSSKVMTLVTLPITVIMLAIPGPILQFWLGQEYAEQGSLVLSLLAAATFMNAAAGVATVTSLGVGRAWMSSVFTFGTSVLNLAANFILIPNYGIQGAAVASLLASVLTVPLFIYGVTRMLKFSLRGLFWHSFSRPLICGCAQFSFLFPFRQYVDSLAVLVLVCALSLGVFAMLSLFWAANLEERDALFRLVLRRIK
jgi:O-antigen/teichoic acid export membrane protein